MSDLRDDRGGYDPIALSVDGEIAEISRVAGDYVASSCEWYQTHKRRARMLFRMSGAGTIMLSAMIPLITSFGGPAGHLAVGIIGVVIACITGLNAFYQWGTSWSSYSYAQFRLELVLRQWEIEMAKARGGKTATEILDAARKATRRLLDEAGKIQTRETAEFFRGRTAKR